MTRYELLCTKCSKRTPFRCTPMKCSCGGTLLVSYDLEAIKRSFTKKKLRTRYPSMWRYKDLLPVMKEDSIVTLGEGWTPLLRLPEWEKRLGIQQLWVKREEQNPTGSFKARGFSVAISLMKEAGLQKPAVPSNGNAAGAMAAYASRAGMQSYAFIPHDCPPLIVQECVQYGAATFLVDGYIHDAAAIIEEGLAERGWTNVVTMKEAGRIEGKKTMGLELAEQLNWQLPSVLIYPTGGGSGIIGMWKAFQELIELGWLEGPLPRFVCVQEQGCQPIVDALKGTPSTPPPSTLLPNPTGMRVPKPPDLPLIVSILEQSSGTAVAVSKDDISSAQQIMGLQGISSSPEGSAAWAGLITLREQGWIQSTDTVVIFNTTHAIKYLSLVTATKPPTIRNYKDLSRFSRFH